MIRNLSIENRYRLFIFLLALLAFLPFNGLIHLFDWDEINFAESAREMIVSGNYNTVSINFIPFWEKPPLFIWMQVLSMKLFGINEFAARFPNAMCGVLTLLLLFEIGRDLKNNGFGLVWALAYGASVLPFLYFKSGIIDPWFNLFIFASLHSSYKYLVQKELNISGFPYIGFSAFFLGLAILTKGPVAILLFGITFIIYLILERKFRLLKWKDILIFSVVLFITGGAYHIYQLLIGNWQLVYDFFIYQMRLMNTEDAGHGGSIFYHPLVLFIGVFPSSIFAIETLFKKNKSNNGYRKLMVVLFLVVLIIFSLIKTKIVHYSSLCYFPISYLAAVSVYEIVYHKKKLSTLSKWLLMLVGFIFVLSPGILQYIAGLTAESLKVYLKDDFAIDCLNKSVYWSGYEFILGIAFAIILAISIYLLRGAKQIYTLFFGTTFFVLSFLFLILPKIEMYSQGPAIEYISGFKNKNVWVSTLGYKSYAPFFYAEKQQRSCNNSDEEEYLLHGFTGREVFFVTKITSVQTILEKYPQLVMVKKDGGFALLKRIDTEIR